MKKRVAVCAAIRFTMPGEFPIIVCGARHFDRTMRAVIRSLPFLTVKAQDEQGFIDQYGEFMSREEAYGVAKAADQIKYRCGGDEGCLYSENLY